MGLKMSIKYIIWFFKYFLIKLIFNITKLLKFTNYNSMWKTVHCYHTNIFSYTPLICFKLHTEVPQVMKTNRTCGFLAEFFFQNKSKNLINNFRQSLTKFFNK